MTPHDANTGRRASKTVGPSEREKDDSGFFYPKRAGLDVKLGLELTYTLIWDDFGMIWDFFIPSGAGCQLGSRAHIHIN